MRLDTTALRKAVVEELRHERTPPRTKAQAEQQLHYRPQELRERTYRMRKAIRAYVEAAR